MEHCQYNLKSVLNDKRHYNEAEIRALMRDICMGFRYLHQNKIVHLDIKPSNFLHFIPFIYYTLIT